MRLFLGFAIALTVQLVPCAGFQAASPSQTTRPPARSRSAESTREFLGLGPLPDAAAAERGEKIYSANCAFCHGAKANGAEGPDLVRSALVLHDEKGELIGKVVHSGRPDRGMPAFPSFTDSQLYDLAEFLHMRVELTANRGTYKVQNVVTGNAAAGETYFNGAGKCNTCHSVTGDLAHIGSKYQPADLQQTFLYPGARGYEVGTRSTSGPKVTVILPSGESISGTLKQLDDFTVSLVDSSGEYHSYALNKSIKVDVEDKLAAHGRLLDQYTDQDMHNLTAYLVTIK